jgi:hypothetical protein
VKDPFKRQAPIDTVSSNPWSQIYKEALPGSEEIKAIWEKIVKSVDSQQLPPPPSSLPATPGGIGKEKESPPPPPPVNAVVITWETFAPEFWKLLGLGGFSIDSFKSEEAICLRLILADASSREVTRERFEDCTKTFSPFRRANPKEMISHFSSIVKLCSQPWFYGIKSRSETEAILNELFYNKHVKNPVVVRLCENRNFQFCLCYIINSKEKKIQHRTYPPEEYEEKEFFPFLQSLVKSFDYKKGLKKANPFANIRTLEKMAKEEPPDEVFQSMTSNFITTIINE